jgi:predicted regulator of Ras-like GTPase activity (Roadblock/LC7/MglB family)
VDPTRLDELFASSPLVEAVVQISRDGLPLAWRCRGDCPVEQIASVAAGLFSLGCEMGIAPEKKHGLLSIDTGRGVLLMQSMPDETFCCVMAAKGCPQSEIESKLRNT